MVIEPICFKYVFCLHNPYKPHWDLIDKTNVKYYFNYFGHIVCSLSL